MRQSILSLAHYGPGGLDRTQRLVVSGIWDLPYFKKSSNGFKRHVLGGYTLALISTTFSGLPESAFLPDGVDFSGTIGAFGGGATYLPGTHGGSIGRQVKSLSQLNALITSYNNTYPGKKTDAFGNDLRPLALLPTGTPLGGDSLLSQDIRVTKALHFTEKMHLDLIGEVFNVFNFANLTNVTTFVLPGVGDQAADNPNVVIGSNPTLSQISTFRPTQRQTSVFGTGGPRAFQFAVKFTF